MIRAIALDDEPPALRVLTHFCQQVDFIDLQKTFTRPDDVRQYIHQPGADLLFLDVNMPLVSGTEFYRTLDTAPGQLPMVIFTTAYADYAVEGFALNAIDYLLKPFTFERFLQAVTKASDYLRWQQQSQPAGADQPWLYVRADYTLYKIALADILFIEGLDDYVRIHLQSEPLRPVVARMTMKILLEKLPSTQFVRVHRSYIVPFSRIEGLRNKTVQVADRDIPVGASYEASLLSRFRS
jgi:DNA-binding LytR/AlgR family response regulator